MKKQIRLSDIEKPNFRAEPPAGYFEGLPGAIQQRIEAKKKTKTGQVKMLFGAGLSAAAVLLFFVLFRPAAENLPTETVLTAEIPKAEISEYLLAEGLETDEIITYYQAENLSFAEQSLPTLTEEMVESEVDLEDLEDYY